MPRSKDEIGTQFRQKLRVHMKRSGASPKSLASAVDLAAAATVRQWLSGTRRPERGMLPRIARELNIGAQEFLEPRTKEAEVIYRVVDEAIRIFNTVELDKDQGRFAQHLQRALDEWNAAMSEAGDVQWLVIPAAGWQPLELGPQETAKHVRAALREGKSAGIRSAVIVVAPSHLAFFERELLAWKATAALLVVQHRPSGVAEAVALARVHVRNNPFAVLFPDEQPKTTGKRAGACLRTMRDAFSRYRRSIVALKTVGKDAKTAKESFGIVSGPQANARPVDSDPDLIWIERIREKPERAAATSASLPGNSTARQDLRAIGRYILTPDIFRAIDAIEDNPVTGRRELTDAINRIALDQPVAGYVYPGEWQTYFRKPRWIKV